MFICEYCGRHLKNKYERCPGCGSSSFKKVQNIGQEIIKVPPKGGYHVNLKNFKLEKKNSLPGYFVALFMLVFGLMFLSVFIGVPFQEADESGFFKYVWIIFTIIFGIALLKNIYGIYKQSKDVSKKPKENINKIKELSKHGMLIKNLKYKIIPVKNMINGHKTVYKIQIIYEIEKGKTKCFESEPKYLTALGRDDGTVDLLIDPNDYNNYFIDFEIY